MHKVTKKREKLSGTKPIRGRSDSTRWEWDIDVYHVVADTYSELITAIDQIAENNLFWHNGNPYADDMGFEGLPHKRSGKWKAKLRTKTIGKGSER